MRFAIVAVLVVVLLVVLAAGASLFFLSPSRMVAPATPVTVSSSSTAIDGSPGDVSLSSSSVGAKIWRDGKRVLFEFDGSGVEIELGAEDGTFDFTKFGEHLTTLDRSFNPAGGDLQEIELEVLDGVPGEAVGELARIMKDRGMRGVKVDGAFVSTEKDD